MTDILLTIIIIQLSYVIYKGVGVSVVKNSDDDSFVSFITRNAGNGQITTDLLAKMINENRKG